MTVTVTRAEWLDDGVVVDVGELVDVSVLVTVSDAVGDAVFEEDIEAV